MKIGNPHALPASLWRLRAMARHAVAFERNADVTDHEVVDEAILLARRTHRGLLPEDVGILIHMIKEFRRGAA